MNGKSDSRGRGRPAISAAAKSAFVWAMRAGASREEAAAAGGYALNSFYRAARRDPAFRAALDEAHAASAEAERRARRCGACAAASSSAGEALHQPPRTELGEDRIGSNNRRLLQRRRMRHVKFDEKRQQDFLAHFSWSCDLAAAAAEAGVCERTVYVHRRTNPAFAAEFQEALEQGYVLLEAEALRQRLAAQQRLREAIESAGPRALVAGEEAAEFERMMKLLARWDRKWRGPGPREVRHGRQRRMSFDDAIELLDKKLRALGVRRGVVPPEGEGGASDP